MQEAFTRPDLMDEVFQFDRQEFERYALYRAIELDNGGMIIAEDSRFGEVFREEVVDPLGGLKRYITEGHIVDEQLRKTK